MCEREREESMKQTHKTKEEIKRIRIENGSNEREECVDVSALTEGDMQSYGLVCFEMGVLGRC